MSLNTKFADFDFKRVSETGEFEGYASVFNVEDAGGDVVVPGAFKKTLKASRSVKMLLQHDPRDVIGIWDELKEDGKGLFAKGRLLSSSVQKAAETHALMKAGALDGLSIGYRVLDWEATKNYGRYLKEVELWEISVVTFPMNDPARVSAVKEDVTVRDVERILRDAGVPNTFAKLVATHGYEGAKSRLANERRDAGGLGELGDVFARATNLMKGS
jgi:HK97 family phage prohead protease